ncbi:hypothetical protein SeLEV6574_g07164 [Synchytrium endobioticum]|nr:hypothetical protein SeLEV6574_g07164 [Synchytrium endobioticum]
MRLNRWQARQETAGPKLLAQIREEAKRKEQAEDADRHRQATTRDGYRQGSSGASGMCGRTCGGLPSTTNGWTPARRGVKLPSARCSIPEQRSIPQAANFQFLRTAKGWKIARRGSEPAAPRAVNDVSPPAADVNSRVAPVAKLTTSSATTP